MLLLMGLLVLVYAIYYLFDHWQNLGSVTLQRPQLLFLNNPLLLINLYASGRLLDTTLASLGINLSASESFGLAALARFGNYLSFGQVGFAIRMYYLKKVHQVDVSQSFSGIALGNILFYLLTASIGIVAALALAPQQENPSIVRLLALIGLAALVLLVLPTLIGETRFKDSNNPLLVLIREYTNLLKMVRDSMSISLLLRFWALVLLMSFAAIQAVEFYTLGYQANATQIIIISCATSFTALINITPAGLGVTEGLLFFSGEFAGVPDHILIASALIRRAVVLTIVTLISAAYAHRLFNESLGKVWRNFRSGS